MPIPEEDSTDWTGTRDWLLAVWRWFLHFLKASGLGREFPAMWFSTSLLFVLSQRHWFRMSSQYWLPLRKRRCLSGMMKTYISYYWWHDQHDLIFPFQGNMYKQCILIAGNMAETEVVKTSSSNYCSDDLPDCHDRWRPSHWSRQQHGDPAKGEAVFSIVLMFKHQWFFGDVFVCSLGAQILICFESALGLSARWLSSNRLLLGVSWHWLIWFWDLQWQP